MSPLRNKESARGEPLQVSSFLAARIGRLLEILHGQMDLGIPPLKIKSPLETNRGTLCDPDSYFADRPY